MTDTDYPAVSHVIYGYLGEDWTNESSNIYEATEVFFGHEVGNERILTSLVADIDRLITHESDEAARIQLFDFWSLYCGGRDLDPWLSAVRQRAIDALDGDNSRPLVAQNTEN